VVVVVDFDVVGDGDGDVSSALWQARATGQKDVHVAVAVAVKDNVNDNVNDHVN
jgi:hypothetical protein